MSLTRTCMPLSANSQAMPPPMTPAPSTPAVATVRCDLPAVCWGAPPPSERASPCPPGAGKADLGSRPSFLTASEAKKRSIRQRHSAVTASEAKPRASTSSPCAIDMPRVWRITSSALSGAGIMPRVLRMSSLRAFDHTTGRMRALSASLRAMGRCARRASTLARPPGVRISATKLASSAGRKARATQRSASPALKALMPLSGLPGRIISSAWPRPTSAGRRWVPPQPGRMPSDTSGRPRLVLGSSVTTR